jgi:hypothetical protein
MRCADFRFRLQAGGFYRILVPYLNLLALTMSSTGIKQRARPWAALLLLAMAAIAASRLLRRPAPVPEAFQTLPAPGPAAEEVDPLSDTACLLSPVPFSDPDLVAPFRGAEQWHDAAGAETIAYPTEQKPMPAQDVYKRSGLRWDELEKEENQYDFRPLDLLFRDAIQKRQKVGFGIMTQLPGQQDGPRDRGAAYGYPTYLHRRMQSAPEDQRDYISPLDPSFWVPNYNSAHYLSRFEALLRAIARHIDTASFQGTPYRYAWGYADIRGYGSWGEWHMVSAAESAASFPRGRRPTAASLKRIIDAHARAFQDVPLVAIISVFDAERLRNTLVPAEVGYHALTLSNRWGKIGWRRDNWGWTDEYLRYWMDLNTGVYRGMRFDTAIMNRWKYAPVIGEGPCGGTAKGGPCPFYDMPRQVRYYHASMIGNGNFCGEQHDARGRDSMRMAWKLSGYRISLKQVVLDRQVKAGHPFRVRGDWQNTGVAPLYEHWDAWFELEDRKTGRKAWSGKSTHSLRLRIPAKNPYVLRDNFNLPKSLEPGTYRLVLTMKDPNGYRPPLTLAMHGRRADGSYVLVESLPVGRP